MSVEFDMTYDLDPTSGSVLSHEESIQKRLKQGICLSCPNKLFKVKRNRFNPLRVTKTPLTTPGHVLDGRCLDCHPIHQRGNATKVIGRISDREKYSQPCGSRNEEVRCVKHVPQETYPNHVSGVRRSGHVPSYTVKDKNNLHGTPLKLFQLNGNSNHDLSDLKESVKRSNPRFDECDSDDRPIGLVTCPQGDNTHQCRVLAFRNKGHQPSLRWQKKEFPHDGGRHLRSMSEIPDTSDLHVDIRDPFKYESIPELERIDSESCPYEDKETAKLKSIYSEEDKTAEFMMKSPKYDTKTKHVHLKEDNYERTYQGITTDVLSHTMHDDAQDIITQMLSENVDSVTKTKLCENILSIVAIDNKLKVEIIMGGGIKAIHNMIANEILMTDENLQVRACEVLSMLLTVADDRVIQDPIPETIAWLMINYPNSVVIQEHAISILHNLSGRNAFRQSIRDSGAVDIVLSMLRRHKSDALKDKGHALLSNLNSKSFY